MTNVHVIAEGGTKNQREFATELTCWYINKELPRYKNLSVENLEKILIEASVFLFPSLLEGFGHVIVEAMHFGLVPVVSPNGCGLDIIKNNVNGYLIQPEKVTHIASKIKDLYSNKLLLKKLRKEALRTSKNLTEENFCKNLISFYNENIK